LFTDPWKAGDYHNETQNITLTTEVIEWQELPSMAVFDAALSTVMRVSNRGMMSIQDVRSCNTNLIYEK